MHFTVWRINAKMSQLFINEVSLMHKSLITAAELRAEIGKGIVLLDCRFHLQNKSQGYQEYRQGHLPGAYYFDLERDLSNPVTEHGGRHPLPSTELLSQKLRNAGVNQQTFVVVYDDSRMAYAARAWWLLRHLGHEQVAILDGGYRAWCAAGETIDKREPGLKMGNFKPQSSLASSINYSEINQAQKQFVLIDSREERRYAGLEEPIDPVAGHIPGAVNYPWQAITDEQGFIKSLEWHRQHWQDLTNKKNIVVYCGSGVTACVNLLSLHLTGIEAKLYPGSWSDWCSYM